MPELSRNKLGIQHTARMWEYFHFVEWEGETVDLLYSSQLNHKKELGISKTINTKYIAYNKKGEYFHLGRVLRKSRICHIAQNFQNLNYIKI